MSAQPPGLPDGTYVSFASALRLDKGGRTAVMLMRARMLADLGVRSVIATVGDLPDLGRTRDVLNQRGTLPDNVAVTNIYDDYATRDPASLGAGTDALSELDLPASVRNRSDGTPYQVVYRQSGAPASDKAEPVDYVRADGSVAVRMSFAPRQVEIVDHEGRVVQRHESRAAFVQQWLRELVGPGDAFIISDSRRVMPLLLGLSEARMHLVAAFHNPHTVGDGRWDSPLRAPCVKVLERLHDLDGLVLLTERQREEIALREGATSNLFVVPNSVEPPTSLPAPLPPRDAKRLVTVARLEGQKRIAHALHALQVASRTDPALRLDVYGDGSRREVLETKARELEIDGAVTFHGYDPGAKDAISTAAAFVLTSVHEGYPLATLEAMSRGCPVISYDIRYGPREQITHGVDGFLVPPGDIETFASRILDLTSDPKLLAKMSAAAYAKAAQHSPQRFADEWAQVFRTVKAQESSRVAFQDPRLLGVRLGADRFAARLRTSVVGRGSSDVKALAATFDVLGEETGDAVQIPLQVRKPVLSPRVDGFRLAGAFDRRALGSRLSDQPVRARLTAVWHNARWCEELARGHVSEGRLTLDALS